MSLFLKFSFATRMRLLVVLLVALTTAAVAIPLVTVGIGYTMTPAVRPTVVSALRRSLDRGSVETHVAVGGINEVVLNNFTQDEEEKIPARGFPTEVVGRCELMDLGHHGRMAPGTTWLGLVTLPEEFLTGTPVAFNFPNYFGPAFFFGVLRQTSSVGNIVGASVQDTTTDGHRLTEYSIVLDTSGNDNVLSVWVGPGKLIRRMTFTVPSDRHMDPETLTFSRWGSVRIAVPPASVVTFRFGPYPTRPPPCFPASTS